MHCVHCSQKGGQEQTEAALRSERLRSLLTQQWSIWANVQAFNFDARHSRQTLRWVRG
jgi:hypothetical protein